MPSRGQGRSPPGTRPQAATEVPPMDEVVRLLIVDDDEAIRSFFAEIFAEDNYWIESAAYG